MASDFRFLFAAGTVPKSLPRTLKLGVAITGWVCYEKPKSRLAHMEKETITTILGSAVGLAGILLVFVGFVYSRAETFEVTRKKEKYRLLAKAGILPFLIAIVSAWLCLEWLGAPSSSLYNYAILSFQLCLILTGFYGIAALLFYL